MKTHSVVLTRSGSSAARDLVDQILSFARQHSIDQATLARRAGISPETLSRLKKTGRCRLATALDLAHAAGLGQLEMMERSAARVAASIAARKLSAGRRLPITAEELVQALAASKPPRELKAHLCGFFEELPIESVHDVVLDERLDYDHLAALAHELGAEGETVEWLEEMARDSVA
jgi:DNA-binding XRE family transcriptional regulator